MLVPLCLGECALSNHCCLFRGEARLGWNSARLSFLLPFPSWLFSVLGAAGGDGGRAADLMLPLEMAFLLGGPSILSCSFISCSSPQPLSLCRQSGWQETFLGSGVDLVGVTAGILLLKGCQPE